METFSASELPIAKCSNCGKRFECGLSPFCSLKCERAHGRKLDREYLKAANGGEADWAELQRISDAIYANAQRKIATFLP